MIRKVTKTRHVIQEMNKKKNKEKKRKNMTHDSGLTELAIYLTVGTLLLVTPFNQVNLILAFHPGVDLHAIHSN